MHTGPDVLDSIPLGTHLKLIREPSNEFDPNAILVYYNKYKLGYLPKREAERLSRLMDKGSNIGAELTRSWWEKKKAFTSIRVFEITEQEQRAVEQTYTLSTTKTDQSAPFTVPLSTRKGTSSGGCLGAVIAIVIALTSLIHLIT